MPAKFVITTTQKDRDALLRACTIIINWAETLPAPERNIYDLLRRRLFGLAQQIPPP